MLNVLVKLTLLATNAITIIVKKYNRVILTRFYKLPVIINSLIIVILIINFLLKRVKFNKWILYKWILQSMPVLHKTVEL